MEWGLANRKACLKETNVKKLVIVAIVLGSVSMVGCSTNRTMVKPVAPGLDDSDSYRKVTEVRLISCHKTSGRSSRTVSVVETVKSGIRFELDGCYGNEGDVFQIMR